jgi:hypothetical protein
MPGATEAALVVLGGGLAMAGGWWERHDARRDRERERLAQREAAYEAGQREVAKDVMRAIVALSDAYGTLSAQTGAWRIARASRLPPEARAERLAIYVEARRAFDSAVNHLEGHVELIEDKALRDEVYDVLKLAVDQLPMVQALTDQAAKEADAAAALAGDRNDDENAVMHRFGQLQRVLGAAARERNP